MYKNILVPFDGSEFSLSALQYAVAFAKAYAARIRVFYALDVRFLTFFPMVFPEMTSYQITQCQHPKLENKAKLLEEAEKILNLARQALPENPNDFSVEFESDIGFPVDLIIERAQKADFVFMGKRGEFAQWGKHTIGDTLNAVLHSISTPLLAAPQTYQPIRKILLAYDGSDYANHALHSLSEFASKFPVENYALCVRDGCHEDALMMFDEIKDYLEPYHLNCHTTSRNGIPSQQIVAFAKEIQADAIIMGAFGHSKVKEWLLGSTTEKVIKQFHQALVLVR